jgi:hypothetical protein
MKYIKSIFEKEFNQNWFDNNERNYLVKNIDKIKKDKHDKTTFTNAIERNKENKKELKDIIININWEDIRLTLVDWGFCSSHFGAISKDRYSYNCSHPLIKDGKLNIMMLDVYKSKDFSDDSFNRIHTNGIAHEYIGLGLAYKCYKRVIKEVGYARSSEYRTNENSRKIWSYLIKDPDFYIITYNKKEADKNISYREYYDGVMVFWKGMNKSDIKQVIEEFSKDVKITGYCDPLKNLLDN